MPYQFQEFNNIQPDSETPVLSDSSLESTAVETSPLVSSSYVPIIRSVDKVPSSIPKKVSVSEDFIRASVGFHQIDTLKRNISQLYPDTIKLDHTPQDAVLGSGDFATMQKKDRNTHPVQGPTKFGDIVHIDIWSRHIYRQHSLWFAFHR
jgi:hypothetical protein